MTRTPRTRSVKSKSAIPRRPALRTASRSSKARPTAPAGNGLTGFAFHVGEKTPSARSALREVRRDAAAKPGMAAGPQPMKSLNAETAALAYLDQALASDAVKSFARPKIEGVESEFKSLGAEAVPLTGTTIVKFRQMFNKIPVYGSYVTVELDKSNACLGINSTMGTPKGVRHIAKISPAEALEVAARASGQVATRLADTPRLYYYFDQGGAKWRLAYIIEDVPQAKRKLDKLARGDALRKDYVVDANTGRLLAELPRTPTFSALQMTAKDGLGRNRSITVERSAGHKRMHDPSLNLTTYTFGFKDPSTQEDLLPGKLVANPPSPWPVAAVAAHANAAVVAHFLRNVVKRNNIDDAGGEMVSSIDCWERDESTDFAKEWKNAFWNGSQMVYGQIRLPNGAFHSVANMLDIVGHEMFHGVTDQTSRLEYRTQAGALNESYSDIFGVIIANWGKPLARWTWRLGAAWDGPDTALRDLQDPTRHEQPRLMKNFRKATPPYTYNHNDYGWVHDNSGIHNYAAYRVMTAKSNGRYLYKPAELAALFFVALTLQLSRTSQFADSRRAVVQVARSLFRGESAAKRAAKIKAVEDGFAAAGIV